MPNDKACPNCYLEYNNTITSFILPCNHTLCIFCEPYCQKCLVCQRPKKNSNNKNVIPSSPKYQTTQKPQFSEKKKNSRKNSVLKLRSQKQQQNEKFIQLKRVYNIRDAYKPPLHSNYLKQSFQVPSNSNLLPVGKYQCRIPVITNRNIANKPSFVRRTVYFNFTRIQVQIQNYLNFFYLEQNDKKIPVKSQIQQSILQEITKKLKCCALRKLNSGDVTSQQFHLLDQKAGQKVFVPYKRLNYVE